ncbi:hypothetical protein Tco_0697395 [Tanacetum coccineum]
MPSSPPIRCDVCSLLSLPAKVVDVVTDKNIEEGERDEYGENTKVRLMQRYIFATKLQRYKFARDLQWHKVAINFATIDSVSIRHIQGVGYSVLEFLGVGTTFDIFQNILFPYSLNMAYCLSWIRRIDHMSLVVFGECRNGYAVSSLMDTAYWSSK